MLLLVSYLTSTSFLHLMGSTLIVWQKLEEENREFFKAYYVRLMLKNQIMVFNRLLEDQYRLMSKEHTSPLTSAPPVSNGSNPSSCMF